MSGIVEEDNIQPPPPYREGGPPQVITADTARQGPKGARVLVVLLASLIGAVAVFGIMSAIWSHS
jgi:hypothetical protein